MAAASKNGYRPRLKELYDGELRSRLKDELELSIMQVPTVSKITLNMGVGDAKTEAKALDSAIEELTTIAGQRAQCAVPASRSPASSCARACRSAPG